jgi:hypothetical protein
LGGGGTVFAEQEERNTNPQGRERLPRPYLSRR